MNHVDLYIFTNIFNASFNHNFAGEILLGHIYNCCRMKSFSLANVI